MLVRSRRLYCAEGEVGKPSARADARAGFELMKMEGMGGVLMGAWPRMALRMNDGTHSIVCETGISALHSMRFGEHLAMLL